MSLSYNLKRICENHKVNLIYEKNFSSLLFSQITIKPNFIFIDSALANECYNFKELANNPYSTKIFFVSTTLKLRNLLFDCLTLEEVDKFLKQYDNSLFSGLKIFEHGKEINNLLLSLGISPNHLGKDYLFECINLVLSDKQRFGCLNKTVYPALSSKYNTNSSNIERDIRHAILTAWSKKNAEKWRHLLNGFDVTMKPSNREFICLCAEVIKMGNIQATN